MRRTSGMQKRRGLVEEEGVDKEEKPKRRKGG